MKRIVYGLLVLVAFVCGVSRALSSPTDAETIRNLETEWAKHVGFTETDVAFQKTILGPHAVYLDVFGRLNEAMDADLEKIAGAARIANAHSQISVQIRNVKVRISGDTAIVTYAGSFAASGLNENYWNTSVVPFTCIDIWQKQSGTWKFIAGADVPTRPISADVYKASASAMN
jgi:ketosteroid isomerase-like protein